MKEGDRLGDHLTLWVPISDPCLVAAFAKLGEELGELVAIKDRTLAQGLLGADPDTGAININELAKEMADVRALIEVMCLMLPQISRDEMAKREQRKIKAKMQWITALGRMKEAR